MGLMTENNIWTQLKKAQGETNVRLNRIIALLEAQEAVSLRAIGTNHH